MLRNTFTRQHRTDPLFILPCLDTVSPKIHPLTGPIVAQVNRSISLACGQSIEGNPLPTAFTWVFHGMLVSGPDTSVELSSLATSLSGDHILPAVDYANAGLYTCTAANFIGNDSITVNLLVLGESRQAYIHNVDVTNFHN